MKTDRIEYQILTDALQRRRERIERQAQQEEQVKARLAAEHSIPRDAKFDKAWGIAWDLGHSSGFSEVEDYFHQIVELIKP
jgi:hypothetical protein